MWPLTGYSISRGYRTEACPVLAFAHLEANVCPICRQLVTQNQQPGSRQSYQLYLLEEAGNAFWGLDSDGALCRKEGIEWLL